MIVGADTVCGLMPSRLGLYSVHGACFALANLVPKLNDLNLWRLRLKRRILQSVLLTVVIALSVPIAATAQDNNSNKGKYNFIEVVNFDVKDEVKFPPDFMKPMMDEIVSKLVDTKKFRQVMRTGDNQTDPSAPTLQLVGTVTEFKPGSRAKRYLISMGAGKTRIVTHIKFIDKASGRILYEGYASGGVSWGLFGGDSREAVTGVGKKIAEAAKKKLF